MRFNELNKKQKEEIIERETINALHSLDYDASYLSVYQSITNILYEKNPIVNVEELDIMYIGNYEQ